MRNWYINNRTAAYLRVNHGSDITYEELIQFHSCSCTFARALLAPSNITYEELIHNHYSIFVSFVCRTLPMRNWYVHQLRYLPEFLLKVGHYLWGIDTFWLNHAVTFDFWNVGHYLWGIDTLSSFGGSGISKSSFKSDITYEELIQTLKLDFLIF